MKKISKMNARQKTVSNILATLRIEQLTPSPGVVEGLGHCLTGQTTTEQLRNRIFSRHVTLRRL